MTNAVTRLRALVLADAEVGPITPHNVDGKYRIGKVLIDNSGGMGAMPDNAEIGYFGFVAFIRPDEFLRVALTSRDADERGQNIQDALEDRGIGNPILYIDAKREYPFAPIEVVGHEGRGRMTMIKRLNGNAPFPVHVKVVGWRARNFTPEFFKELSRTLITEAGQHTGIRIHRIFCAGKEVDLE